MSGTLIIDAGIDVLRGGFTGSASSRKADPSAACPAKRRNDRGLAIFREPAPEVPSQWATLALLIVLVVGLLLDPTPLQLRGRGWETPLYVRILCPRWT